MKIEELLELTPEQPVADTPSPPLPEKELEYYRDYVMIESKLVNDTLILCFDKKNFKRVKKKHPGIPIYFEPEINELWKYRDDKETIKGLHAVKKQFQGWIVPSDNQVGNVQEKT